MLSPNRTISHISENFLVKYTFSSFKFILFFKESILVLNILDDKYLFVLSLVVSGFSKGISPFS